MAIKDINMTSTTGGGQYFSKNAELVLDTRTLAANTSKFSTLNIKTCGAYIAARDGKTFGVWWMWDLIKTTNGDKIVNDYYGDGGVYNTVSSSSSYERVVSVNYKKNIAAYLPTDSPIKLNMNWQQFHRKDSGYESTDINDIAGWSTTQEPYLRIEYDLAAPTVSSVVINNAGGLVDDATTISWSSTYQSRAIITVNGRQAATTTTGRSVSIASSYLVVGENNVSVQVFNDYSDGILGSISKSASATAKKTLNTLTPTISGVGIENEGSVVDKSTIISWNSANQHRYQIYINDTLATSGTTAKTATLTGDKFKIGSNKILIRVIKNAVSGVANSERSADYSTTKTYSTLKPTVSNIIITNDGWLVDNPTNVSWQSTNQHRYNIYVNSVLAKSGTTATRDTIEAGKFKVGPNVIRVEIIKNAVSGVAGSEQKVFFDTNKDYTRIMPTLSNISLTGTNRDYPSKVSFNCTNATNVKLYLNGTLAQTWTTGAKEFNIAAGVLRTGTNSIKLEAYRATAFDSITVNHTLTPDIEQNIPLVYSLEPNEVPQNIDEVIDIAFATNEFCDRWEITAAGETFRGTTARSIKVAKNRFRKGTNNISIKTYYSPPWSTSEIRNATRVSSFNGYGKPALPIHDGTNTYNTSKPVFTWRNATSQESDVQTAFEIEVLNSSGTSLEKKTVFSSTQSYTPEYTFENKTTYVVLISIKNKYNMWSDWATKVITTSFNELPVPQVKLFEDGNNALISWEGIRAPAFSEARVLRREEGGHWIEIGHSFNSTDSMVDYMIKPNITTHYKIRVLDTNGAYSDSSSQSIMTQVRNYSLTDIEDKDSEFTIDFATLEMNFVNNSITKKFAGTTKPTVYTDKTSYETGTFTATLENHEVERFLKLIYSGKIFCLRDRRGKKLFGFFELNSQTHLNPFLQQLSLTYTEINFNEYKAYRGQGKMSIVYSNGEYFLDGVFVNIGDTTQADRRVARL